MDPSSDCASLAVVALFNYVFYASLVLLCSSAVVPDSDGPTAGSSSIDSYLDSGLYNDSFQEEDLEECPSSKRKFPLNDNDTNPTPAPKRLKLPTLTRISQECQNHNMRCRDDPTIPCNMRWPKHLIPHFKTTQIVHVEPEEVTPLENIQDDDDVHVLIIDIGSEDDLSFYSEDDDDLSFDSEELSYTRTFLAEDRVDPDVSLADSGEDDLSFDSGEDDLSFDSEDDDDLSFDSEELSYTRAFLAEE